jgi:hypothetical protein
MSQITAKELEGCYSASSSIHTIARLLNEVCLWQIPNKEYAANLSNPATYDNKFMRHFTLLNKEQISYLLYYQRNGVRLSILIQQPEVELENTDNELVFFPKNVVASTPMRSLGRN